IGPDPSVVTTFPDWLRFGDHTSGHGNMLITGGTTVPDTSVWSETVPVLPNTEYTFSFWGATINQSSLSQSVLQPIINGAPVGSGVTLRQQGGIWVPISVNWFSGPNTTATLSIVDTNTSDDWNDFTIDDIRFAGTLTLPPTAVSGVHFISLDPPSQTV